MTGYAPNPISSDAPSPEKEAASLTSGLLARKGQAAPAVDAVAHEGIDIDMRPAPAAPRATGAPAPKPRPAPPPRRAAAPQRPRPPITIDAAPQPWSASSQMPARARLRLSAPAPRPRPASAAGSASGRRATVTFRMPAADFVRLRFASRDMKESCQSIIVDAVAAYLDANDVAPVDEETAQAEITRIMTKRTAS